MADRAIVEILVDRLSKRFTVDGRSRTALDSVSLQISPGEFVALIGASGSGKSTLLRQLSGLIGADAGDVRIGGRVVQHGGDVAPRVRNVRADVGMIFQQFNLVNRLTVLANVLAGLIPRRPLWRTCLMRFSRADRLAALEALDRVGMADCAHQRAGTLSGGQQQRVAIARTLVQGAKVVLADEPIASLDPESARRVMDILARINHEDGVTCLVSLHQVDYAVRYCRRAIGLADGKVVFDGPSSDLTTVRLSELYGGAEAFSPSEPAIVELPASAALKPAVVS